MGNKLIVGSDHAGFSLKKIIIGYLEESACEVVDAGCFSEESADYPKIAFQVSKRVARGEFPKGILICGSGIGMSMAANRFPKIRAALCNDYLTAKLSREHNNSNILVLGSRVLGVETAKNILEIWLSADFLGGRHQERIEMFDEQFPS